MPIFDPPPSNFRPPKKAQKAQKRPKMPIFIRKWPYFDPFFTLFWGVRKKWFLVPFFGLSVGVRRLKVWGGLAIFRSILRGGGGPPPKKAKNPAFLPIIANRRLFGVIFTPKNDPTPPPFCPKMTLNRGPYFDPFFGVFWRFRQRTTCLGEHKPLYTISRDSSTRRMFKRLSSIYARLWSSMLVKKTLRVIQHVYSEVYEASTTTQLARLKQYTRPNTLAKNS